MVLSSARIALAVELGGPGSSLGSVLIGVWVVATGVDYYLNPNRFISAGQVRLPVCMLAGVGLGLLIVSIVQ